MKSVTEFANVTLAMGLKNKAALTAESKTPEEIATALGATFKYEGDKLKHFMNALEVAGQHSEGLKRVLVVSLAEGENAPAKSSKADEFHYVPEFHVDPKRVAPSKDAKGGRGGRGGKRDGGGQKESPWGLSPEQKAAKKGKQSDKATPAKPS